MSKEKYKRSKTTLEAKLIQVNSFGRYSFWTCTNCDSDFWYVYDPSMTKKYHSYCSVCGAKFIELVPIKEEEEEDDE